VVSRASSLSRSELEKWLAEILVPIEPESAFIHRLRARLVTFKGQRRISAWAFLVAGAAILLILTSWVNLALRVVLGVISLIRLGRTIRPRRQKPWRAL
jgi:hypothetical protein